MYEFKSKNIYLHLSGPKSVMNGPYRTKIKMAKEVGFVDLFELSEFLHNVFELEHKRYITCDNKEKDW